MGRGAEATEVFLENNEDEDMDINMLNDMQFLECKLSSWYRVCRWYIRSVMQVIVATGIVCKLLIFTFKFVTILVPITCKRETTKHVQMSCMAGTINNIALHVNHYKKERQELNKKRGEKKYIFILSFQAFS